MDLCIHSSHKIQGAAATVGGGGPEPYLENSWFRAVIKFLFSVT
jgi:hypothetical protein